MGTEFLLAVQFLTRIPVTVRGNIGDRNVARAMAYFPAIGLLLGIFAVVGHRLLSSVFAAPVTDFLVIAFMVTVTGNLHGDALMDTADGIFSGRPRERMLEIMRDSRVGSNGVMAGILVILARYVLLGQLPPAAAGSITLPVVGLISLSIKESALVLAPLFGRWAQVYGAAVYNYARTGSGVGTFTEHVGRREMFWGTITALAAAFLIWGLPKGGILAVAVFAGTAVLIRFLAARIGGVTGDILGALNEGAEVLVLIMIYLILKI